MKLLAVLLLLPLQDPGGPALVSVTAPAEPTKAALAVLPKNNPWNEDISRRPVHPNSDKLVASVGREKSLRVNVGMAFVLVPAAQPKVEVKLSGPGESDKGPYPVPDNAPIEGWP